MRTYEERAQYILKQRDERFAKRRRIRSAVTLSAVSVCSLALIVGIGAAISNAVGKNGVRISPNNSTDPSGGGGAANSQVTTPAAELVYNEGDIHSTYKFTMPEFPDVDFAIDNGVVTADGKKLFGGQMTAAVFLADLNGDGCRELCTDWGVSAPTTPLDMGISAYDYSNGEYYALSDPAGSSEYHLSLEDGKLKYKYYLVLKDQSIERKGEFTLSDMRRVSEDYFVNNGEAPAAERVFLSGDLSSAQHFTMPEFPDVDFSLENGVITADGKKLFGGRTAPAIYLDDLNNDGLREICTDWGVYPPSIPLDIPISAYDYLNDKYYVLSDPTGKNSRLTLENGMDGDLGYSGDEEWKPLALSNMKCVSEAYFINNGEGLPVEKIYIGNGSEFTMPEFPDVNFKIEDYSLYANDKTLYGGTPISAVYLADLNGDGCRELCTDWGMPVPGSALSRGICVLDLVNDEYYVLEPSDPERYEECYLSINDGVLVYSSDLGSMKEVGTQSAVTLAAMKRVTETYFISNGRNLIVEKIYDQNDHPNPSEPFEFTIPEFPGVNFKLENYTVYANGKTLYSGMPISTVCLADLNDDGYRELCSEIAFGSGIIDIRILVYDYANSELYELSDRGKYDYALALEDRILKYKRYTYHATSFPGKDDTPEEEGALTLSMMKRVPDSGEESSLPVEKLYPRGNKDVEDILELNDNFEFTIPELSESSFKLEKGVLSRDGETLLQGYPVHSIYLTDLNGDGVCEICAEYSAGSGIVDMNIFVYDPKAKESYKLDAAANEEYVLTLENGVLGYKHCVYSSSGITTDEQGELTLSVLNKLCGLPKADSQS